MILQNHKLQIKSENSRLGLMETVHWQYWNKPHCQRLNTPGTDLSGILFSWTTYYNLWSRKIGKYVLLYKGRSTFYGLHTNT